MADEKYARRIPESEWHQHEATIRRLYVLEDKPLTASGGVLETMSIEYGFSATKAQYETRLKKWRIRKYKHMNRRCARGPLRNHRRVEDQEAESHARHLGSDTSFRNYPLSRDLPIRSPSSYCSVQQPAPLSLFTATSPSPGPARGWQSHTTSFTASARIQSLVSPQRDGFPSLQEQTWNWNANSCADDPVNFAWYRRAYEDSTPATREIFDGFGIFETSTSLQSSPYGMTAGISYEWDDPGSPRNSSFARSSRSRTISSRNFTTFSAISIMPVIIRMLPKAGPFASLIPTDAGGLLESAIRDTSHPDASHLIQRQRIDHQFIYMIFHRLINGGDSLRELIDPKTTLDRLFKLGITYCLDLGENALSAVISSTPTPHSLALIHSLFCAALIMGHGAALSAIIGMGGDRLVNRPAVLADSQYYPLEYTSLHGHITATQVLLDHGADPNLQKHFRFFDCVGKLPFTNLDPFSTRDPSSTRVPLLRLLFDHGLEVPLWMLRGNRDRDELLLLAHHYFDKSFEIFIRLGALPEVLLLPDWNDSLSHTLKCILDRACSDKDFCSTMWNKALSESLSCAVLRSHSSAIEILLAMGARPSVSCLISAARSSNLRILEESLDLGLDPSAQLLRPVAHDNQIHRDPGSALLYGCTALSESIRNPSKGAFDVLQARGCVLQTANQPTGLVSALIAACEVGDSALVEQLLSLRILPQSLPNIQDALCVTVDSKNQNIVKKLLSLGIKPTIRCLQSAIKSRHLAIVELLVELMDISNYSWSTESTDRIIIFEALRWGNQVAIKHVLRMGHPINIFGRLDYSQLKDWNIPPNLRLPGDAQCWALTPLSAAMLQGNSKAVRALIAHGAKVASFTLEPSLSVFCGIDPMPLTPLAAATVRHDIASIRDFLRMGADPFDNGALFVCAVLNLEAIITLVLSAFRNRYPDGEKAFGSEALCYSIRHNNTRLVGLLAKDTDIFGHIKTREGCDRVNPTTDMKGSPPPPPLPESSWAFTSPIGEAIYLYSTCSGTDEMLELLLPLIKDLNAVVYKNFKHGSMTCLTYAISLGSLKTVQKLHQVGANISLPAEWEIPRTPLQAAAQAGSMEIVGYLLGQGVRPNEAPAKRAGGTALQLAAIKGHIGIAAALFDVGAEVNAKPAVLDGRTAFEGATEHGRIEMMLFLYQHGADLLADDSRQYRRAVQFAEDNLEYAAKELADELHAKAMARVGTSFIGMSEGRWTGFDIEDFTEFLA